MYAGKIAQIMDFLPWEDVPPPGVAPRREPRRAHAVLRRAVPCAGVLTGRESLRDIEASLSAQSAKLYHMGIRSPVRRSTLADANERRDFHAEFAQRLIAQARKLYAGEDLGLELGRAGLLHHRPVPVRLSLGPVPLHEVRRQAARASGPARQHSGVHPRFRGQAARRQRAGPAGSGARRLLRHGPRLQLRALVPSAQPGRLLRRPGEVQHQVETPGPPIKSAGVLCDQTIVLTGVSTGRDYPQPLRRVKYRDAQTGRTFNFLNHFAVPAATVADLYRNRWQLFFKWIKQHLRIKSFLGTSENAVKTQIWVAVSVYVLVAIVRKRLGLDVPLYTLLQVLSVTLFEKTQLNQGLFDNPNTTEPNGDPNQLNLFEY